MAMLIGHGQQQYYVRQDLGLPQVVYRDDNVTPRPLLNRRLGLILCHYTGVPVTTKRYATVDTPAELATTVLQINLHRRNEYNYVITQSGDIAEFAGAHEAAHCGPYNGVSFNPISYGVLFLNAVEEPITWAQIAAFAWLKNLLRWVQAVTQDVRTEPHKWAKPTGCPGPSISQAMPGLQSL